MNQRIAVPIITAGQFMGASNSKPKILAIEVNTIPGRTNGIQIKGLSPMTKKQIFPKTTIKVKITETLIPFFNQYGKSFQLIFKLPLKPQTRLHS
jgi:hypothetical protein